MRRMLAILCAGAVLVTGKPGWSGGEDEAESFKDTIRAMQERIKELEDEVSKLKGQPPPAPVAAANEDLTKRVEKLEGLSILQGIEVHGLLSGTYTYNFNRPKSHKNGLLLYNEDDNTFSLNHANVQISKSSDTGLGFLADLDFGDTAEIVGGATRWSNNVDADGRLTSTESRNSIELRQAYLTYKFNIGNGLTLKAGKMVTLHGAEVIKSWNSFNYNISNSILFGWAIPFTHTGIMASYPLNDYFSLDLGLMNGWDNVADNNDGKTLHGGLTIKPHEKLSFYISGSYGPEQDDRGGSKRSMLTTLVTYKPLDRLTLILDHNWGSESDLLEDSDGDLTKGADWHGLAGYAIFGLTDKLSLNLRGEWFSDMDGVRTGVDQDLWEITPTLSYTIADGFVARVEYRHDDSSRKYFEKRRGGLTSGQDVIATEILYGF